MKFVEKERNDTRQKERAHLLLPWAAASSSSPFATRLLLFLIVVGENGNAANLSTYSGTKMHVFFFNLGEIFREMFKLKMKLKFL